MIDLMKRWGRVLLCAVLLGLNAPAPAQKRGVPQPTGMGWPEYGGTAAGQRYSAAAQISQENVGELKQVWSLRVRQFEGSHPRGNFEATPVLWQNTLYLDTPRNMVLAVDAQTGVLRWKFDPHITDARVGYIMASRGVALWHETKVRKEQCSDRVFVATIDRRLMALDARDGAPCEGFGQGGSVNLTSGIYVPDPAMLEYTSPPQVVGDNVILGSSIADNQTTNAASGAIRAFDARTGRPVWTWEPVRWVASQKAPHTSGGGNAWAPLAADPAQDLVFVPTGSASVDYYGGMRVGDNRDADSIVALRASTGQKVWSFQLVHHNLWDYDTASQPLLFTWRDSTPAVAVTNKTGMIYVFNRLNGEPLFPIQERKVPQTTVPGEVTWRTQPFSTVDPLLKMNFSVDRLPPERSADEKFCRDLVGEMNYQGPFTPPSLGGTVIYPAALGGPNWGSSAVDPKTSVMYTRVSSMPYLIRLLKRDETMWDRISRHWQESAPAWLGGKPGIDELPADKLRPPDMGLAVNDLSIMSGAPYRMLLRAMIAPSGIPCGGAPYGRLVATDLNTGKQLWSVPNGSMRSDMPGSIGMSGPIATAGGLVFVAASDDAFLHAYDERSGQELWRGKLPAAGTGTPMTYVLNGRQYVVVAVANGAQGDELLAFGLDKQ